MLRRNMRTMLLCTFGVSCVSNNTYEQMNMNKKKIDEFMRIRKADPEEEFQGCIMSGTDFNKIFTNEKLVKFTNWHETHHKMHYKDGLNIDVETFTPGDICGPGGIYFTFKKYEKIWASTLENWEREVVIPDEAIVQVLNKKVKTNMLILKERKPINTTLEG